MKKVFTLIAVAAMMAACGNCNKKAAENTECTETATECTVACDTCTKVCATDSTACEQCEAACEKPCEAPCEKAECTEAAE